MKAPQVSCLAPPTNGKGQVSAGRIPNAWLSAVFQAQRSACTRSPLTQSADKASVCSGPVRPASSRLVWASPPFPLGRWLWCPIPGQVQTPPPVSSPEQMQEGQALSAHPPPKPCGPVITAPPPGTQGEVGLTRGGSWGCSHWSSLDTRPADPQARPLRAADARPRWPFSAAGSRSLLLWPRQRRGGRFLL